MPHHGMTPHVSGYLIVEGGALAGAGAHSYSEGNATGGAEEAEREGITFMRTVLSTAIPAPRESWIRRM